MSNLNTDQNSKPQTIGLLEIQNFACNCEALFYNLYLKTQVMVDAKKYLAGTDKDLYKHDNLETTTLLKTVIDKCGKLVYELNEQYEHLTVDSEKKLPAINLEINSDVNFVEVFY